MKFQKVGMKIGPTGLPRVGTMMTIGGVANGRRAVMVGSFADLVGRWLWMVLRRVWIYLEPVQMSVSHDNRSDVQKAGSVGSMIINPLLYDLTCETTGGLRFVHEHDLAVDAMVLNWSFADMEAENRLVVDFKDFDSELADMV